MNKYPMVVGVCHIGLLIHGTQSLKGKRQVLKKVIEGVKNRFNASVSEVGCHDLWQRSEIGITVVGVERGVVNSALDKIIDFIEHLHVVCVLEHDIEFISFDTK